jgi:hypothetical protein
MVSLAVRCRSPLSATATPFHCGPRGTRYLWAANPVAVTQDLNTSSATAAPTVMTWELTLGHSPTPKMVYGAVLTHHVFEVRHWSLSGLGL